MHFFCMRVSVQKDVERDVVLVLSLTRCLFPVDEATNHHRHNYSCNNDERKANAHTRCNRFGQLDTYNERILDRIPPPIMAALLFVAVYMCVNNPHSRGNAVPSTILVAILCLHANLRSISHSCSCILIK